MGVPTGCTHHHSSRFSHVAHTPVLNTTEDSWLAIPRVSSTWLLQGVFEKPEAFSLYAEFLRHHGMRARMAAFRGTLSGNTWWVVDTRYAFQKIQDASQFLHTHAARIAEGHPLLEPSIQVGSFTPMLFGGMVRHPSTGTFFMTFIAVGTYRHYLYSFLAAVEIAEDPPPANTQITWRPFFLQIFQTFLSVK